MKPALVRVQGGIFAAFAVVMGLADNVLGVVLGCLGVALSVTLELTARFKANRRTEPSVRRTGR